MSEWIDVDDDATGNEVVTDTGPFALVPVWVLEMGLSGSELAVYVSLRSFADASGDSCYPLTKTIAERAGVAAGTVRNVVSKLRKLGMVATRERRRSDGSTAGLQYLLTNVRPPSSDGDRGPSSGGDRGCHEVMTPVTDQPPDQTDQSNSPGGLFEAPEQPAVEKAQGRQPQAPQPSTEPLGGDTDGLDDIWEWFEKAWEVYGRKGSKKTAKSRWIAAIDRVLAGRREVNDKRKATGQPERYGYGQLFGEAAAEWLWSRAKQYASNRPDRTYRKDFERWLGHEIFATPECEPNVMATTYTSEFDTGAEPGQMPWEGPWDEKQA
jgi:hypothetical protein